MGQVCGVKVLSRTVVAHRYTWTSVARLTGFRHRRTSSLGFKRENSVMDKSKFEVPVKLPQGWLAEQSRSYGTIITAVASDGCHLGYVTVDEKARGFALGISPVRVPFDLKPGGRGWREKLYKDAIARLAAVHP